MNFSEIKIMKDPENDKCCSLNPILCQFLKPVYLMVLFQVHSLFSLLGLNHAYVTNTGRLAGVVALKEVCEPYSLYLIFAILRLLQMHPLLLT